MSANHNHTDPVTKIDYPDIYVPTPEEFKARNRRNIAIAIALVCFVIFVFLTLINRAQGGGV